MYARKEELADLLKIKLINRERLTTVGHYYSLGKTTITNFTDVNRVIQLLSDASGYNFQEVVKRVNSIGKGKFDELMKSLKQEIPETDFIRLEAQVGKLMELEYQPRLQSVSIRKA